jgi:hypothetical protein
MPAAYQIADLNDAIGVGEMALLDEANQVARFLWRHNVFVTIADVRLVEALQAARFTFECGAETVANILRPNVRVPPHPAQPLLKN